MKKAKQAAFLSSALCLALILSYVESLLPVNPAVPGIKIGLPNLVIVFLLYRCSEKEAVMVSWIRVLLIAILFGNLYSFLYSISGAVLSLLTMVLMKKTGKFRFPGVSVSGACMHNVGQILMAALILRTGQIMVYLPVLLISGILAGILIGILSAVLVKRIPEEILCK